MRFFEALLMLCMLDGQSRQAYFVGITNGIEQRWPSTYANRNAFKPHYNFGLAFEASKESLWGIGGDVRFTTETVEYANSPTGQNQVYNLNYLRAPLRLHLYMNKLCRRLRPKVGIGPFLGYLIGTDQHVLGSEQYQVQNELGRNFNQLDIGVQCMTGVNIRLSENMLMNLDLTCYNGFLNIDENHTKTQGRAVNVGLLFKIR